MAKGIRTNRTNIFSYPLFSVISANATIDSIATINAPSPGIKNKSNNHGF